MLFNQTLGKVFIFVTVCNSLERFKYLYIRIYFQEVSSYCLVTFQLVHWLYF